MPPLIPQAPRMRPTSIASSGQERSSCCSWALIARRRGQPRSKEDVPTSGSGGSRGADGLLGGWVEQARDGGRGLRADALPVRDAIEHDAQRLFLARGHRVVEADALQVATVAAFARVGDHDVVERALLGAAAGKSNDDHDEFLSVWCVLPRQGDTQGQAKRFCLCQPGWPTAALHSTPLDTLVNCFPARSGERSRDANPSGG